LLIVISSPLAPQTIIRTKPRLEPNPQPTITTTSLPFGGVGQPYSAQMMAVGGNGNGVYTWTIVSGNIPPGLSFDTDNGQFSNAPTAAGNFVFTVQVQDTAPPNLTATKLLSIGVMEIDTPAQLPEGSTCGSYFQRFVAIDGPPPPYTWSLGDPTALPGLSLDPSTGVLSGKPTQSGPVGFTVTATSPGAGIRAIKGFNLSVSGLCFAPNGLPNGDANSPYRQSLVITGGVAPFSWKVQSGFLPLGINLDATSGLVSGTPTKPGPYSFTIQVTDSANGLTTETFSISINPALAFASTSPLAAATAGVSYSQTLMATGGAPPYVFTTTDPPQGLTLSSAGVLSGTPSIGMFIIPIVVTDSLNNSASMNFDLTAKSGSPLVEVSPSALTFTAVVEGDAPHSQHIDVVPVGAQPTNFQVVIDGGTVDAAAPGWISLQRTNATAPARLVVSVEQGNLAVQTANARVRVIDASGNASIVTVTLNVVSAAPQLQVTPDTLHFAARAATPGTLVETLGVRSVGGGGPVSFSTSVVGKSGWISSITPASGQTVSNSTVFLKVEVNTQGLEAGSYHDVILISSSTGAIKIPVALFVARNGAILDLSVTGIRFQARQGGGFSNVQNVEVLDVGDPASNLTWSAELVSGSEFFSVNASRGFATPFNPGMLTLSPAASALQMNAGGYYGLLKITSSEANNSPLYVVLVLDLASSTSPPLPDLSPAGLVFIETAGRPFTTGQLVNVNTSSATPAAFQAAVQTADGGTWLTASPTTGTATGQLPGEVTATVDASQLAAGIYSGELDISMSGVLRSVNVTLIVEPGATVAARPLPATVSCTPSALAATETGLVNNFAVPAGWPAALIVQLNDDCGNSVSNASVTASFSNGDPPLMLAEGQPASYAATWQPGAVSSQIATSIQAQFGQLKPAELQLIGNVNGNQSAPPSLFENGTVNVFNRVPAGALAPGMIVEVYGTGLASATGNPGVLPLPSIFQGTSLIVGAYQAPLYFVSSGQLDVQVAAELTPNQQYPVIAILNGALSVPVMADLAPIQLGLAAQADGQVIAQHGADSSYVDANHPAKPGEVLVIYLSGMGPTNPAVKSGDAAPASEPLARVTNQPTVTLNGENATVQFAGLSPGFVGLYQVNFQVPASANSGDLTLVVSQGGVSSNATKLTVAQ
jgi:uncharacterized protein (TIGR03437 family)